MNPLSEDVLGGEMPSFKDFFRFTSAESGDTDGTDVKDTNNTRIQKGLTGMTRQRQNLVPDKDKINPELVRKVEILRNSISGKQVLNGKDLKDILTIYKIKNLAPNHPRDLGTTGITVYFDDKLNSYCIGK